MKPVPPEVLGLGLFFGGAALFSSFVVIIHRYHLDQNRKGDSNITKSGALSGLIGGATTGSVIYGSLSSVYSEFKLMKFTKFTLGGAVLGTLFGGLFCLPAWRTVIAHRDYGKVCVPPSWEELQQMRKSSLK